MRETRHRQTLKPRRPSRWFVVLCLTWAAFIFATSCTVVRPQEFFDWIHRHLISSDAIFGRFQVFWGVSWFAIVKGWHACEFGILLLFCVAGLNWVRGQATVGNIGLGVVLCVGFAASDEWHQTFVPDRGGTVTDVLIDSLGVMTVAMVLLLRRQNVGRFRRE